ncbi:protein-export chaperone SecB [gamma proteobacterium HTCC5015]|nr:protein-export chaperone SecB [gamma proteobacterium HTCC5015]
MSEEAKTQQAEVHLQKIYLKDASLESPNAPEVFRGGEWKPDVNVEVNTEASDMGEGNTNVVLTLTVTVTQDDKTLYLVEIAQAGIFTLRGLPDEHKRQVVSTFCPTQLFPFAREAVSGLVERAGFPQLVLQPMNFDAMYRQHLERQQQTQAASTETAH